jgi:hypothetical protein
MRNWHKYLVGDPEIRRPLGRPRYRCEVNINVGAKEIRCEDVDWNQLSLDRVQLQSLVNTVITLRFLKRGEPFDQLSDFRLIKNNSTPWS